MGPACIARGELRLKSRLVAAAASTHCAGVQHDWQVLGHFVSKKEVNPHDGCIWFLRNMLHWEGGPGGSAMHNALEQQLCISFGTAQYAIAQRSTAQHSTAQHSTAQHSTAQHSTAQQPCLVR